MLHFLRRFHSTTAFTRNFPPCDHFTVASSLPLTDFRSHLRFWAKHDSAFYRYCFPLNTTESATARRFLIRIFFLPQHYQASTMCKYRYIYYSECKHFDFFLVEYCKAGYLYHLASSPAPGELTSSPVGATPAQDKSKQPRSPLSSIEGRQHAASGPEKQGGGSTGTTMDKVVGLNAVSQQTSLYILETQQHAFHGPTSLPPALSEQPRTTDGQILELGRAIEEAKAAGPPGSPIFRDFSPSDGTVKQLVAQLEATFHSVEAANLAFDAVSNSHSSLSSPC